MSFAVACPSLTSSTPLALMEPGCFKFVLSKTLGYGIVAGSAGVKLPQVAAILRAANVSGLAGSTILIEMISSISSVAYFAALGYPFSTWGESCFILLQQAIITALYFHYTGGLLTGRFAITASAGGALGVALYQRSVPDLALPAPLCDALGVSRCSLTCTQLAGSLPVVLMLVGRVPQILQNLRQGHTGQLALATFVLNVAGCAARVFTVLHELDDKLALVSAISGLVQNLVLVAQIVALGPAPGFASAKPLRGGAPRKAE